MLSIKHEFLRTIGKIFNSKQSKSIIVSGNIFSLFHLEKDGTDTYVPLVDFLLEHWKSKDRIIVVYELNGPVRFTDEEGRKKVKEAWLYWRSGMTEDELAVRAMTQPKLREEYKSLSESFDQNLLEAMGKPTMALEMLRQFCLCSRSKLGGKNILNENLIIIIEAADLLIPQGEISQLSDADRHRTAICQDWFSDPGFMNGNDSVILLSESRSLLNQRVARLPQILEVEIPSPDERERGEYITWFSKQLPVGKSLQLWGSIQDLARYTGGLSIHALRQLLMGVTHEGRALMLGDVVVKVEEFIKGQIGEDVVEFKKPTHTLRDVIGYRGLRKFLEEYFIPRVRSYGPDALPGAAVCGPIGAGKTFIFEAVAAELDMVVLVLKNLRSQWFGQTDVIFERLRRLLNALSKVLIFVDEADTQFGSVEIESHSTERRLTGKIQAMMSDTGLRGKVVWLLMTARIHLLSPDIRRPGRVGDLIIPILDPEGEDKTDFIRWMVKPVFDGKLDSKELERLDALTEDFSSASFASLRSELIARANGKKLAVDEIIAIAEDIILPDIQTARRYQTLQALVNCTRKSLLPEGVKPEDREKWALEIQKLEATKIH